jgi:hypothetical protein
LKNQEILIGLTKSRLGYEFTNGPPPPVRRPLPHSAEASRGKLYPLPRLSGIYDPSGARGRIRPLTSPPLRFGFAGQAYPLLEKGEEAYPFNSLSSVEERVG